MYMSSENHSFNNSISSRDDNRYFSHFSEKTNNMDQMYKDYNCSAYLFPEEKYLFISNLILMILSFLGNGYMIVFICGQKKARNAHNVAIVSIAVADIVISFVVIPTYFGVSHYQLDSDSVTPFLCKIHKYIYHWCKTVKIYSILAMVIDRYYRVTKPTRNSNLTGRCIFFLSFVWFFGAAYNVWEIVLNTSALITLEDYTNGYNITIRHCISSNHFHFLQEGFKLSGLTVTYAIPLLTITSLYSQMLIKGYYLTDRSLPLKSKRRLLLSMLSTVMFYMCQLPTEIIDYVIYISEDVSLQSVTVSKLLDTISFSQGVLCFICYVVCSTELHMSWKSVCSNVHCFKRPQGQTNGIENVRLNNETVVVHDNRQHCGIQILITGGSTEHVNA